MPFFKAKRNNTLATHFTDEQHPLRYLVLTTGVVKVDTSQMIKLRRSVREENPYLQRQF